MKKQSKAGRRGAPRKGSARKHKIGNLKASVDEGNVPSSKAGDWAAEVGRLYRPIKQPVTLRLDGDVLAWFKAQGKGYQTRINRALRRVMTAEKRAGADRS